jgi:manganese transport protein
MSSVEKRIPSWLPIEKPQQFVSAFGPGLLFAATIFGAGSIYILSTSGARFGFTLLWTLPFALLTDLGMREMAGRLGALNQPLMAYIRGAIGAGPSKVLSTHRVHYALLGDFELRSGWGCARVSDAAR